MVRNSYKKRQGLVFAGYCLTIKDMLAICRKKSGKNLNSLFFIATAAFARPNSKKYIMYVLFWRKVGNKSHHLAFCSSQQPVLVQSFIGIESNFLVVY